MCNLSKNIEANGIKKGIKLGIRKERIDAIARMIRGGRYQRTDYFVWLYGSGIYGSGKAYVYECIDVAGCCLEEGKEIYKIWSVIGIETEYCKKGSNHQILVVAFLRPKGRAGGLISALRHTLLCMESGSRGGYGLLRNRQERVERQSF